MWFLSLPAQFHSTTAMGKARNRGKTKRSNKGGSNDGGVGRILGYSFMSNNDSNQVELNILNFGLDKKSTGEFLDKLQKCNEEERTTLKKSLIAQLEQRDNKVRLQVEDEVKKRLAEFKTQVASGASAKEVLEAQAQAANQVLKGVLLGVGCALVVGLVVLAAVNYMSKEDSRAGHVQDNAGSDSDDDSDDDWRIAARGTSKERLAFSRKKLKDIEF